MDILQQQHIATKILFILKKLKKQKTFPDGKVKYPEYLPLQLSILATATTSRATTVDRGINNHICF